MDRLIALFIASFCLFAGMYIITGNAVGSLCLGFALANFGLFLHPLEQPKE